MIETNASIGSTMLVLAQIDVVQQCYTTYQFRRASTSIAVTLQSELLIHERYLHYGFSIRMTPPPVVSRQESHNNNHAQLIVRGFASVLFILTLIEITIHKCTNKKPSRRKEKKDNKEEEHQHKHHSVQLQSGRINIINTKKYVHTSLAAMLLMSNKIILKKKCKPPYYYGVQ